MRWPSGRDRQGTDRPTRFGAVGSETLHRRKQLAKFKIATPAGASFTTAGGGYDYEMEPLQGIDAEIVEGPTDEDGFIKFARDADAIYAKGMRFTKKVVDGLPEKCRAIVLGSVGGGSID